MCKVENCVRPKVAQGYCGMHYQRLQKWGDPNFVKQKLGRTEAEKFWPNVRVTPGCWIWTAPLVGGYGRIFLNGKAKKAHRTSYELNVATIPDGLLVLHRCDNRKCVNPDHLFLGTHLDNCLDKMKKGRGNVQSRSGEHHWMLRNPERIARGERVWIAKMTKEKVIELRREYATGSITQRALAVKHGIGYKNLNLILNRKTWTHI